MTLLAITTPFIGQYKFKANMRKRFCHPRDPSAVAVVRTNDNPENLSCHEKAAEIRQIEEDEKDFGVTKRRHHKLSEPVAELSLNDFEQNETKYSFYVDNPGKSGRKKSEERIDIYNSCMQEEPSDSGYLTIKNEQPLLSSIGEPSKTALQNIQCYAGNSDRSLYEPNFPKVKHDMKPVSPARVVEHQVLFQM